MKCRENTNAQAKSKSNITKGLCKNLKELKITTNDEGYLVLFKDFSSCNCSVRKLDTTMQISSENKYKPSINIFTPCRCSISTRIGWHFGQHKKKCYGRLSHMCGIDFQTLQILPTIHFGLFVTMKVTMAWGATHGNMPNVLGW